MYRAAPCESYTSLDDVIDDDAAEDGKAMAEPPAAEDDVLADDDLGDFRSRRAETDDWEAAGVSVWTAVGGGGETLRCSAPDGLVELLRLAVIVQSYDPRLDRIE